MFDALGSFIFHRFETVNGWLSPPGEIVRLLKSDRDALRELAAAIVSEPELRLSVINAVVADMTTKQDLQQLRHEFKVEIGQLRREINQLRKDMNTNFR